MRREEGQRRARFHSDFRQAASALLRRDAKGENVEIAAQGSSTPPDRFSPAGENFSELSETLLPADDSQRPFK